ncbi:MAG: hypothetical protein H7A55_23115 [Verrucomicrobiaceae bacterium]|nr:hypothetical protein [Verrucomicrobiaceae bacterium]
MTAKPELNDTDEYILAAIRKWVWSGFYTPDEVDYMIDDILEGEAHEDYLRSAVGTEFAKKREDEKTWPEQTDCDRLDSVFTVLEKRNILCLQNAGYEMSDGHQKAFEVLSDQPGHSYTGYCFYHGQDLERALDGGGLMIAFDHVEGDVADKVRMGLALKEELECAGFQIEWDGTADQRINVPKIEWKRRYRNGE